MLTKDFVVYDDRFKRLAMGNVHVEKLAEGCRWAEGPAYFAAGKYLIWSDIPNDRLMRYDETDGSVSVFATPCNNHNGHTVDLEGRLVCCEHRGRAVTRIEHDGSRKILADVTAVVTDMVRPNGLAFSPDESILYVADTGLTHKVDCSPDIRAYPVAADGKSVGAGRHFATSDIGLFDGFRVDISGNIWSSCGDGVNCYAPDGTLIGKIKIPEVVANVEFGARKRNRLYICGTTSLYAVYLNTQAAKRPAAK